MPIRPHRDPPREERTIRWLLEWKLPKPLRVTNQLTRSTTPLLEAGSLETRYEVGLEKARLSPREGEALMETLGVEVNQLCPQQASKAARRRRSS